MDKKTEQPHKKKRTPRKISARYLENAALYYLQRYATSVDNLRQVLTRKVNRSCAHHDVPPDEFYPQIESLLERYVASGLLNDKVYAEGRVGSLRRQGRSKQGILSKLQSKGLARNDIEEALERIDTETRDDQGMEAEFAAALKLARKKKIGTFNVKPETDPLLRRKEQQRELAMLARNGFSYDIAKRALNFDEDADSYAGDDAFD
jgi:regulatory protein